MDLSARLEMSVTAPPKPFIPDTNPPLHVFILFSVRFPSEWNLDFWRWSMIAVVAIIESCPWQLRDILSNLPDQSNWGAAASEIDELSSSYKSSSSSTSLSSSSFSCILSFCREVNKSEAGLFYLNLLIAPSLTITFKVTWKLRLLATILRCASISSTFPGQSVST